MASVTTLLNTAPAAAPLTVPIAPKNDPAIALAAAAPAPATTLVTVRSLFFFSPAPDAVTWVVAPDVAPRGAAAE
jgi:hypothetical protein